MTFSIALPKSLDTASSAAGLTSEKGQKSAGFEGTDGFAELLNQLASFTPPAGQDDTVEADRQAGDLPTGKELPLAALVGLPALDQALAVPTAIEAKGGAGKPAGDLVPNASKPDPAMTAPMPRAPAPGAGLGDAAGEEPVQGLEVRITAAQEPRDPRAAGMVSSLQNGKAVMELPATAARIRGDAAAAVTAAQGDAKASIKAAATETAIATAAPAKAEAAALQGAGTVERSVITERKIGGDKALAEKLASKPRTGASTDAAKSTPQALALAADGSASTIQPVSSAARPIATDQFANVERVVEHLMAARQFDLSKPAAIAVAHKEFGALTLTFDHSAGGMNVEIAAEDGEAQRALAAAMANDRGANRPQELAAQSTQSATQSGQTGGERGAAANNAGTGSGNTAGDDQRQQPSDQRSRHGERTPNQTQTPAQSSSDDALYA